MVGNRWDGLRTGILWRFAGVDILSAVNMEMCTGLRGIAFFL